MIMGLFGPPNINKLKTKGNVQGLIRALNYKKDPTIRRDAAKALGEIGDSLAVEPLIEIAIGDDSIELRIKAIDSLGKLGDIRAVEPLLTLRSSTATLISSSPSSSIYSPAGDALKKFGNSAVDVLIDALSNSKRSIRDHAAEILFTLSWKPSNNIEKASYCTARREVMRLMELDYHSIKPFLIQSLKWDNHPDDFYLNAHLARFIIKTENNLDAPIVTRAIALLEDSIREYPKAIDKIVAKPLAYDDDSKFVSKSDKLMFGDYTDIIRSVISYKRVVTHSWDVFDDYEYETFRSFSAIKHLCGIDTPVSNNLLHHFTKLKDVLAKTTNKHPTFGKIPTTKVSFEMQRSMAISELAKRGNPKYNLFIYKAEDCWRIQKKS